MTGTSLPRVLRQAIRTFGDALRVRWCLAQWRNAWIWAVAL